MASPCRTTLGWVGFDSARAYIGMQEPRWADLSKMVDGADEGRCFVPGLRGLKVTQPVEVESFRWSKAKK